MNCVVCSLKPGSANVPNKAPVRSVTPAAVMFRSLVGKARMLKRYILPELCVVN